MTMNGTAILKNEPIIGAMRAERRLCGGEHALDDEEVRGPVAEADGESEAEDDAGPVDAHGVIGKVAHAAPHVRVVAGSRCAQWRCCARAWP